MNLVTEATINHLKMITNGALMITGDWGSGKTHFIRTELFKEIEKEGFIPIMISVYGETEKTSIAQKVFFSYHERNGGANSTSTSIKFIQGIFDALPKLGEYINLDKIIGNNSDNLLKLLPQEKLVVFFDDVERLSEKMDINDFFGLINGLVTESSIKVVLVANADKFAKMTKGKNDNVIYLEKTVEKVVHFAPEMSEIMESLTKQYTADKGFHDWLTHNRSLILQSVFVANQKDAQHKELSADLNNIRTIKFALEHFRLAFLEIEKLKSIDNDLTIRQLRSLWLFALAVSVEFRKGEELGYKERKGIDEEYLMIQDLSLADIFDDGEQEINGEGKDGSFAQIFRKLYFERLGESYFFFGEVYDLITGGRHLDGVVLCSEMDTKFYAVEGKVNPANLLLEKFTPYGLGDFSNEDFPEKVSQLYKHLNNGEFQDINSYFNATNLMFFFKDILQVSEDDVMQNAKHGIELWLPSADLETISLQISTLFDPESDEKLKSLAEFTLECVKKLEQTRSEEEVAKLNAEFIASPEELFENLTPNPGSVQIRQEPKLNLINLDKVQEQVMSWSPKTVTAFRKLLHGRYNGTFASYLEVELPFLESVRDTPVEKLEDNLSKFLIKQMKRDIFQIEEQIKSAPKQAR